MHYSYRSVISLIIMNIIVRFKTNSSYPRSCLKSIISAAVQHLKKSISIKSYRQEFNYEFTSNLKYSSREIRRELSINKISKIDTDEDIFGSDNLSEFLLSKKANIIQKSPEGII